MKIKTTFDLDTSTIPDNYFDICFVGNTFDDRGRKSIEICRRISKQQQKIEYHLDAKAYFFGQTKLKAKDFEQLINPRRKNILIEATTLGLPEIYRILRGLSKLSHINEVSILYTEPVTYTISEIPNNDGEHDYLLSNKYSFDSIPGTAGRTDSGCTALCQLGFENTRLLKIFEPYNSDTWTKIALFGVPAFDPGWEHISFKKHLNALNDFNFSEVVFSGANDIENTYKKVLSIYEPLRLNDKPFVLIPLGTKPQAIAALLFMIKHHDDESEPGIIYDHPEKLNNRSTEVRQHNMYRIVFPPS